MNPYIPITEKEIQEMLEVIGAAEIGEVFADIPEAVKMQCPLALEEGKSELEVYQELRYLAGENMHTEQLLSFLGAGAYERYIPAIVKHLAGRSEFYTAYTPYQPEISQGTLQVIFEYQSMICELTGMDVTNASMYDGASAAAEAAIMACVQTKRNRLLCSEAMNPETKKVLETYLRFRGYEISYLPLDNGTTDHQALLAALDKDVAGVLVQNPNFFGVIEEIQPVVEAIKTNKSLLIVSADPISLGVLKKPAEYGADIVVGEGQQLGGTLSFGGPYLGFIACTEKLMRKMPGRIAGQSVDVDGKRAFVLTLQAREQHIRRYKATSNICSNQAHNALIAAIYLITMGKQGLQEVAMQTMQKSRYLYEEMQKLPGYEPLFPGRKFFSEFAMKCPKPVKEINEALLQEYILGGYEIETTFPAYPMTSLFCVTETKSKGDLDEFVEVLGGLA